MKGGFLALHHVSTFLELERTIEHILPGFSFYGDSSFGYSSVHVGVSLRITLARRPVVVHTRTKVVCMINAPKYTLNPVPMGPKWIGIRLYWRVYNPGSRYVTGHSVQATIFIGVYNDAQRVQYVIVCLVRIWGQR